MKSTNNNGIEKDASLLYTVKCGVASFISTCISGGMLHPLELIKTRFQSKFVFMKVMMESLINKTLFLNIVELSMLLNKYYKNKKLKVFIKGF
jgi:hypothetical protein